MDFLREVKISQQILKNEILVLAAQKKRAPFLAIIQVGNNEASNRYISHKIAACNEIRMLTQLIKLAVGVTEDEILKIIDQLNNDEKVDGIIIQLPLPKHLLESKVINAVHPRKDVDGFTASNLGALALNLGGGFYPATVKGVITCLNQFEQNLEGKIVTVVGQSNIVGKPLVIWLINQGATVVSCNKFTNNLFEWTQKADVIVSAAGVAALITADMIREGAVILDVGTTYQGRKVLGDVERSKKIQKKAKYISSVPGGIGLLTVMNLINNVMKAYRS